jgi:iron complex transport system ATP-binding protein
MGTILKLNNTGYRYGDKWAVKNVSMDISPGDVVGVLGPNGSGKSTLLRLMDGLIKAEEGEIFLEGESLAGMRRSQVARGVAMVSQESYFQFSFSVLQVVLMGRFPHLRRFRFEGQRDMEVAQEALKITDTLAFADRDIHALSGGERQRVMIARALAQEPVVLLLDEPTSFMDLKYKREIFRLIKSLSRERKLAVVVVSHDIGQAAQFCNRLVILKQGRVYRVGTPEEVITEQTMEEVFECAVIVDDHPATGRPRVTLMP